MAVGGRLSGGEGHQEAARVVAFADLGMEAIYEFEVEDMRGHRGGRLSGQQHP